MSGSSDVLSMVADVSALCLEGSAATGRGVDLVDRIREQIPFDAAALSIYDPILDRHLPVASRDYPEGVLAYLNGGFTTDDPAFLTMRHRQSRPLRWCDIPRYADAFSAHEVFIPGGFNEGVTTCLFTRNGRYTGSLHLSSDVALPVSDVGVDALVALRTVIGSFVDQLRVDECSELATVLDGSEGAVLFTAGGQQVDVGIDDHAVSGGTPSRSLASLDPVAAATICEAATTLPGRRSFYLVSDPESLHVEFTPLVSGTVATWRAAAPPRRLTHRELQVLGLLSWGRSNAEIGADLHMSRSTVATHVERILEKLNCHSRAGAAARAVAEGISAPPMAPDAG